MTVFRDRRRDNRWSYEFQLDGRRYQGVCDNEDSTPCRSKGQAIEAESRRRKQVRIEAGMAKSGIVPGGFLLAQALDLHLESLVDCSESHRLSVTRITAELLTWFGIDRTVGTIGKEDVTAYRSAAVAQKRRVWIGGPRKRRPEDFENPRLWKELDRPISASEVNHKLDLLRCALDAAHKVRDPMTGHSALPFPPEVPPVFAPKRQPTPMPEAELDARLAVAMPWTVDAAMLGRLFGCRAKEALRVGRRHIDRQERCLRFKGAETKSGRDEALYGGEAGWDLLLRLEAQALRRGQENLVTWPGIQWARRCSLGRWPADDTVDETTGRSVWQPLKSVRRSWRTSSAAAGVEAPHRFHDTRAAYISDVARLGSSTITKNLARHSSMATTEGYIGVVAQDLPQAADEAARRRARLKVVK